jgi:hypothetical protein
VRPPTNPRYLAYAREDGLEPDQALARDVERWPGGKMCGFMLWVGERWREWDARHGHGQSHVRDAHEHRAFDAWLEGRESSAHPRIPDAT